MKPPLGEAQNRHVVIRNIDTINKTPLEEELNRSVFTTTWWIVTESRTLRQLLTDINECTTEVKTKAIWVESEENASWRSSKQNEET